MLNKKIVISVLLIVSLLIVIGYIIVSYVVKEDNVRVRISPKDAVVKIGDNVIETNKPTYINPGKYPLSITADNFAALNRDVTITDTMKELVFCLVPTNMTQGEYLVLHPEEQLICEGAGGQEYNEETRAAIEKYPIIARLPYEDGTFLIGQDITEDQGDIFLTVHYSTEKSKKEALEWIHRQAPNQDIPITYFNDYGQVDRIGGVDSQLDQILVKKYPIIKSLPLDAYIYKLGYRIDQSDASGQSIKITVLSDTASGRVSALRGIYDLGYNATDYKIEFINFESGLK